MTAARLHRRAQVLRDVTVFLLVLGWMSYGCGAEDYVPTPEGLGGAAATGPVTGGADATGGVATGGDSTGGVATGGLATGGLATGGLATGGLATGGLATGGLATGGLATGGSCYHFCDQPCSACH